jgi:CDP-4-dehydro-6-deoxyglucose reductase
VAYDTAFGPVKSLIEHAINLELEQPMHLFWLTPEADAPYLHNYCRSWADALDNLTYRPVTGVAATELDSLGSVVSVLENLSDHDAYVAGPPSMTDQARAVLLSNGLPGDRLFMDTIS